jgi:hypothetical protein
MKAIALAAWLAALVCGVASGCAAQAPTASEPPPGGAQPLNQSVPVTMTCGEFNALLKSGEKRTGGLAILWLDGYYSGRSGLEELPAGWVRTVSQGVGGTCAISQNEQRTVLDVVGQIHREYGSRK